MSLHSSGYNKLLHFKALLDDTTTTTYARLLTTECNTFWYNIAAEFTTLKIVRNQN